LFYLIALLIVIVDQAFKLWVRINLDLGESLKIWDGFHFTYYQNSGAMGSTFQGYGRYFIIPAVLMVWYLISLRRKGVIEGGLGTTGAALFAGGAVGNAIDRLLFGWVTDFLDFGRGVSNIADHALMIGLALLLLSLLMSLIFNQIKKNRIQA